MTIGAEIRNENVTPSGTPVVTNPMNSGTAEQEQNGVTTPSNAPSRFPADSRLPERIRRVRSGVKNDRTTPTPKTTSVSSRSTLGTSNTKNSTAVPKCRPASSRNKSYVNQRLAVARLW